MRSWFLLFLLLAAIPTKAAHPERRGGEFAACADLPGARCGTVSVLEDRGDSAGRRIELAIIVVPGTARPSGPPVFYLSGGPGESATAAARFLSREGVLTGLLRTRDVIFVDQRGAGGSNPLACPQPANAQDYFGEVFDDPTRLQTCRTRIEAHANLAHYTTTEAAHDLDEVRRLLGHDRIHLWAGSYGTRLAMEYLRRYPRRGAGAILDGVAPFDAREPLRFAGDAQAALDRLFEECAADPACAAAYPDLAGRFDTLVDLFRQGPRSARVRTAPDAAPVAVPYSLGDFGYTVRGLLYGGERTANLPRLIARAAETGNFDDFAQAYLDRARALNAALSMGLYLTITCSEGVANIAEGDATRWTADTFLGEYLVDDYRRACTRWPRARVPSDFTAPLRSNAPILIFSGGRDPATPPHDAEGIRPGLPHSLHVVFPWSGHGVSQTECGLSIMDAFLRRGSVSDLDVRCASVRPAANPFALR